jgi:hypothetical protein
MLKTFPWFLVTWKVEVPHLGPDQMRHKSLSETGRAGSRSICSGFSHGCLVRSELPVTSCQTASGASRTPAAAGKREPVLPRTGPTPQLPSEMFTVSIFLLERDYSEMSPAGPCVSYPVKGPETFLSSPSCPHAALGSVCAGCRARYRPQQNNCLQTAPHQGVPCPILFAGADQDIVSNPKPWSALR